MYVYNDFYGYGLLEMVENMILDIDKAKTTKDKWIAITTLTHFVWPESIFPATIQVIGKAFLNMLHLLEQEDQLKPDSEYKDLSLIMSMWLGIASTFSDCMDLYEDGSQPWPEHIVTYSKKHNVDISVTVRADEMVLIHDDGKEELPKKKGKPTPDRWAFKRALKNLRTVYGSSRIIFGRHATRMTFSGDGYDITKWSRKERAEHSFDKKDPLPDEIVRALERGEEIQLM